MIVSAFRTQDVPAVDRLDMWRETLAKAHAPTEVTSEHKGDFRAEMRLLETGAVAVWPSGMKPIEISRGTKHIRQSDPEVYHLTLMLKGLKTLVQEGREGTVGPREMQLANSSSPFRVRGTNSAGKMVRLVGMEVPRALLPLPPGSVDGLITRPIPGREGFGALLAGVLVRLARDVETYRHSDGARLETVLVDLLSATLAEHLDSHDRLSPESRTRALVLQIRAFITKHLHDPALTPPSIAAAHHISVSHLHRLFQDQGTTVSAWVRRQRLERARRDLTDPALSHLSVQAVAARYGFSTHSVFTRAFRAAYGAPPSEVRAAGREF